MKTFHLSSRRIDVPNPKFHDVRLAWDREVPLYSLGDTSVNTDENLKFVPNPIDAVGIRVGDGPNVRIAIGIIQRTTALRACNSFGKGRDWMEELSTAYVVALATRRPV